MKLTANKMIMVMPVIIAEELTRFGTLSETQLTVAGGGGDMGSGVK